MKFEEEIGKEKRWLERKEVGPRRKSQGKNVRGKQEKEQRLIVRKVDPGRESLRKKQEKKSDVLEKKVDAGRKSSRGKQ